MDIYQILRVSRDVSRDELTARFWRTADTYQMVIDYSNEMDVREIAQVKLNQLKKAGEQAGITEQLYQDYSGDALFSNITNIRLALNSSSIHSLQMDRTRIMNQISQLPDTAEKHYMNAVYILRTDGRLDGLESALNELQLAVEGDPENEVYKKLVMIILEQIEVFSNRVNEEKEARSKGLEQVSVQTSLDQSQQKKWLYEQSRSMDDTIFWGGLGCLCCGVCCMFLNQ